MTQPAPTPNARPKMSMPPTMQGKIDAAKAGNKYRRTVRSIDGTASVSADVYAVLEAFEVTCPAVQHAAKKLLCAGIRGHKGTLQDLTEARQALDRAIQMATDRDTPEATAGPQS